VLRRKCAFKNIQVPTFDTIKTFFDELAGDWVTMLNHQLPALPPLNSFWDDPRTPCIHFAARGRAAL
jgi:hypothetical protein